MTDSLKEQETACYSLVKYFNNPEDSDIKIQLKSGRCIFAHKLILKLRSEVFKVMIDSRMKESVEGVVVFPDHSDKAIEITVMTLYGHQWRVTDLTCNEWFEVFRFAHYINLPRVIDILEKNIPYNAASMELIQLAVELDNSRVMKSTISGLQYRIDIAPDADKQSIYEELVELDWDTYQRMHSMWITLGFSHPILLAIDCKYCSINSDDAEMLRELFPKISIETFSTIELHVARLLPIIREDPIITHLLTVLGTMKSKFRVDTRSLSHGSGSVDKNDPRRSIDQPMIPLGAQNIIKHILDYDLV